VEGEEDGEGGDNHVFWTKQPTDQYYIWKMKTLPIRILALDDLSLAEKGLHGILADEVCVELWCDVCGWFCLYGGLVGLLCQNQASLVPHGIAFPQSRVFSSG